MTLLEFIAIVVKLSIFCTVLSFGLRTTPHDAAYLFKHPKLLIRALLPMTILMPLFVGFFIWIFPFDPIVEFIMVGLSVSPVPPLLPKKAFQTGKGREYTMGMLFAMSIFSLFMIPLVVGIFEKVSGRPLELNVPKIVSTIFMGIIIPMLLGMLIRKFAEGFAERVAAPLSKISLWALLIAVAPVIVVLLPSVWELVGNGSMFAIAVFVIVGITFGHLLGGPDPDDRNVLAVSAATRHPGIAIAVAGAAALSIEGQSRAVPAALILYLIVSAIVAGPYIKWLSGSKGSDERESSDGQDGSDQAVAS